MAAQLSSRRQAGFTLTEMLISLLVLMVATAIAAQLLSESAQMFVDVAAEQMDTEIPLALNRIRSDAEQASTVTMTAPDPLPCLALALNGGPAGTVGYTFDGQSLRRTVIRDDGTIGWDAPLIQRVTNWTCQSETSAGGATVLRLTLTFNRRALRHSPLAVMPADQGSHVASRTETLFITLRGGGMGTSW
jgi:type II secretory pathway pseudopilin PulG